MFNFAVILFEKAFQDNFFCRVWDVFHIKQYFYDVIFQSLL